MKPVIVLAVILAVSSQALAQLTCSRDLASQFDQNIKVNDADGNGFVSGQEIVNDFKNNYDKDSDGCVSVQEWVDRWTSFFGFSREYSLARLSKFANVSSACPIKYDNFLASPDIPVPGFLSDNIQTLIDVCRANTSLYTSNCDCFQIRPSCNSSNTISNSDACKNFMRVLRFGDICDNKGRFGDRFMMNVNINDANADGFVTGPEIFQDFKSNYDTDKDGCCSVKEWTERWESFFKFSKAYAIQRLTDIVPDISAACPVKYGFYENDVQTKIPDSAFIQDSLESLVKMCRAGSGLVRTNCDCAQLEVACTLDPRISGNVICKNYVANPLK